MKSSLKLSTSSQCIKYLMFICNLLFVITGIILLSIGSLVHGVFYNYEHFLDSRYFSVPSLLIVVGSIIFFIAFFGCCGAVRENYCMIITFSSLMFVVFVLELFAGIYGYVLRNDASEVITEKMSESMKYYQNSSEIHQVWDMIQTEFKCCGITQAKDWLVALDNETVRQEAWVPLTCCSVVSGRIGFAECRENSTTRYPDGCMPAVANFVKEHAVQLGGFGIGIAFVQAMGIWLSIYLAKSIKRTYINM